MPLFLCLQPNIYPIKVKEYSCLLSLSWPINIWASIQLPTQFPVIFHLDARNLCSSDKTS